MQPLRPRWYGALLEDLLVSIKNTVALSCTPPLFFCLSLHYLFVHFAIDANVTNSGTVKVL